MDGNKRVAVRVTAAFLRVNGYRLEFDDTEALSFLVGLYETGTLRFKELEVCCTNMLCLAIHRSRCALETHSRRRN